MSRRELTASRGVASVIIAVQDFHEHGSLGFTAASVARYLYGIRQSGSLDRAGRLTIETTRVDRHRWAGKDIPSGFFDLEGSEHVSAILWTNAGTAPKFTRMALAGPYPDPDVSMVRFGSMYDHDPDAFAPAPFMYVVAGADAPEETWGQEAVLFHNPHALHPVPTGLFETVAESFREGEGYADFLKGPFVPYYRPRSRAMARTTSCPPRRSAGRATWASCECTKPRSLRGPDKTCTRSAAAAL